MNSYNEATKPSSQSSLFLWLICLLLLLSSISGWYFYLQADGNLKKTQIQKQRVQKQYRQKSDELYESWDKIQNYQNKNYQLSDQLKECKGKTISGNENSANSCQEECTESQSLLDAQQLIISDLNKEIKQLKAEHKSIINTSPGNIAKNNSLYCELLEKQLEKQIEKFNKQMGNLLIQVSELSDKQHPSKQQIIAKEKQTLTQQAIISKVESDALNQLRARLIDNIEARNITISRQQQGNIVITINNDLIFRSKQVNIIKNGTEILLKTADLLQQFPNRKIQVIGHTDNLPVRSESHEVILSNWELSAFRSGAVIRYLQHAAKVAPQRMMLFGASQYQPLENGNEDSIRAKNRRIEIRLLAEDNSSEI